MKHLQKYSLLLVSLLVISSGVLLPSLPEITAEYSHINSTLVELLSTLPALFTMMTVSFSPRLARRIGYKKTVQLGLLVTFISGFTPMFSQSFALLFLSRVTFGIGVGLFNPLLFSFSSEFYEGKELSSMLGFQSAFEGAGGIMTSFLVASLVSGGWRNTLWTYAVIIPIFILFSLFVPDISRQEYVKDSDKKNTKIDTSFIGFVVLLVVLITVYMSVSVKLTALLIEKNYGDAAMASTGLALMGVGAMLAGLLFGTHIKIFKDWLLPIAFSGLSLSLFILSQTNTAWVMISINFFIGLCFRTFMPFLFNKANQVSDGSGEKRTALLLIGFNIGSAFAPVSIRFLQNMLGLTRVSQLYSTESILIAIIAIGAGLLTVRGKNEKREKNNAKSM